MCDVCECESGGIPGILHVAASIGDWKSKYPIPRDVPQCNLAPYLSEGIGTFGSFISHKVFFIRVQSPLYIVRHKLPAKDCIIISYSLTNMFVYQFMIPKIHSLVLNIIIAGGQSEKNKLT